MANLCCSGVIVILPGGVEVTEVSGFGDEGEVTADIAGGFVPGCVRIGFTFAVAEAAIGADEGWIVH